MNSWQNSLVNFSHKEMNFRLVYFCILLNLFLSFSKSNAGFFKICQETGNRLLKLKKHLLSQMKIEIKTKFISHLSKSLKGKNSQHTLKKSALNAFFTYFWPWKDHSLSNKSYHLIWQTCLPAVPTKKTFLSITQMRKLQMDLLLPNAKMLKIASLLI